VRTGKTDLPDTVKGPARNDPTSKEEVLMTDTTSTARDRVWAEIQAERDRQAAKWAGPHQHGAGDCSSPGVPLMVKLAVLGEEYGEVCRAALDWDPDQMRAELVQVAAVAVAILEGEPG
jgi:hypothetical protein